MLPQVSAAFRAIVFCFVVVFLFFFVFYRKRRSSFLDGVRVIRNDSYFEKRQFASSAQFHLMISSGFLKGLVKGWHLKNNEAQASVEEMHTVKKKNLENSGVLTGLCLCNCNHCKDRIWCVHAI